MKRLGWVKWQAMKRLEQLRYARSRNSKTMYAFYDLEVSPATFDFVRFLVLAEMDRQKRGLESLYIVVVPGRLKGFRDDAGHLTYADLRWRLNNIIQPCSNLMPSCSGISVFSNREDVEAFFQAFCQEVFPENYLPQAPLERYMLKHIIETPPTAAVSLKAIDQALEQVDRWLARYSDGRLPVTITLRECEYETDRNSNVEEWGKFVQWLDKGRYFPVILQDTASGGKPLDSCFEGAVDYPAAIWNIHLRAALYERAHVNLHVNNGPSILCRLNWASKSATLKLITDSSPSTTRSFFEKNCLKIGDQLPGISKNHRLVWEDDHFEAIRNVFEELTEA